MQVLARTGIELPNLTTDPFTYRAHLASIANALEQRGVLFLSGSTVSRPAPGTQGRVYLDTTRQVVQWDTGITWLDLNPPIPVNAAAGIPALRSLGTDANQAAPGVHGAQHAWNGPDPAPPVPRLIVERSATLTVAADATTAAPFQVAPTDPLGMWTGSAPARVTFPASGVWTLGWRTNHTGGGGILLAGGGGSMHGVGHILIPQSPSPSVQTHAMVITSTAGSWIDVAVTGDSSGVTLLSLSLVAAMVGA